MDKILSFINEKIEESIKKCGLSKEVFDKFVDTSGMVILAYVVLRFLSKSKDK